MFATVELYEDGKKRGRIRQLFYKPKIIREKIDLSGDEFFYKLKVPLVRGEIPYEKLREITFSIGEGLIFEKGIAVDERQIPLYKSRYFPKLMLFNSAVSLFRESIFEAEKTSVTVFDERGELAGEIHRLVPFASEIAVVTYNRQKYGFIANKLMKDYGLSLLVTKESDKSVGDSAVIIAPDSSNVPLFFKGLLITESEKLFPFATVLVGRGVKCEEKYLSLCPDKIDERDFVSALYEAAFQRELHFASYAKLVDICRLKG